MSIKIDVDGALAHLESTTGEKLSHYQIESEMGISRMSLNNWKNGKGLKTLIGIVRLAKRCNYPIHKIIKTDSDGK